MRAHTRSQFSRAAMLRCSAAAHSAVDSFLLFSLLLCFVCASMASPLVSTGWLAQRLPAAGNGTKNCVCACVYVPVRVCLCVCVCASCELSPSLSAFVGVPVLICVCATPSLCVCLCVCVWLERRRECECVCSEGELSSVCLCSVCVRVCVRVCHSSRLNKPADPQTRHFQHSDALTHSPFFQPSSPPRR